MIRNSFSGMSLLARFTLVSFCVTLLVATGLALRLESTLERDALSAVAENTADQASNILNKNLFATDLIGKVNRYRTIEEWQNENSK